MNVDRALGIALVLLAALSAAGYLYGGAECDRSTCDWWVQVLYEGGPVFALGLLLVIAALLGRLVLRRR